MIIVTYLRALNEEYPEFQIGKRSQNTRVVHYPYRKTELEGVVVAVVVAVLFAGMALSKFKSRIIRHVAMAKSQSEGNSASVRRSIGGSEASIYFLCLRCSLSCKGCCYRCRDGLVIQ